VRLWRWFIKWYGPLTAKPYIFLSGGIEGLLNAKRKQWGMHLIKEARKKVNDTITLKAWYSEYGFVWRKDKINCYSKPWLTAAKWGGDCEDFALLSWEVLRGNKKCVMAVCHGRKDGKRRGHAILLVYEDDQWRVMSNMYRLASYDSKEKAAESVYGDKTVDYFFVG
jgi:predicted transglutaminase-like cysteine proteinase